MKTIIALLTLFMLTTLNVFAQEVEMADTMRSNGKIYVVVAVFVAIFMGLVFYLISIDKKISKLEKEKI